MGLYQFIDVINFGSLFFLAILTAAKKNSTYIGYRFLALFFVLLSFNFIDELCTINDVYKDYYFLTIIFQPSIFGIAPAFYVGVLYLTLPNKRVTALIVLHFVPYIFLTLLYIIAHLIENSYSSNMADTGSNINVRSIDLIISLLLFSQIFTYLFLSAKQLYKHKKSLPLFTSNFSGNDYGWLSKVIIVLTVLSVVWLVESLVNTSEVSFYFSFVYVFSIYYLGIQVVTQKDVFPFTREQIENVAALMDEAEKNEQDLKMIRTENKAAPDINEPSVKADRKQVLSDEKLQHYKVQLLKLMDMNKPYLDAELTLPKLAKMLLLNTYQTSYLINASFNENFYNFVNRYRVEECKHLLESKEYKHLSILGIAYQAGFNSKTAFNTTFKKIVGVSPKQFKDNIDQSNRESSSSASKN